MQWYFILAFTSLTLGIGIENVSYDGAYYSWINGSGGISPFILFNSSSGNAQLSTTESYDFNDALSRMEWQTLRFGFSRWSPIFKRFTNEGSDDLKVFQVYNYANDSYWQTEANGSRSVGLRTLTLGMRHHQYTWDDYINQTWRINVGSNFNLGFDLWAFEAITEIQYMDSFTYGNDTELTGAWLNDTFDNPRYMDNVSMLAVANFYDGKGWTYRFTNSSYGHRMAAYNGSIYIGFNLGRIFRASTPVQWSLEKIDADPCQTTCQTGDSIAYELEVLDDPATQVPNNKSYRHRWTDVLGTCSTNGQCALAFQTTTPYNSTKGALQLLNASTTTPPGSAWMTCNLLDPPAGNCTYLSSFGQYYAYWSNPVKNTWYYLNATQVGRYNLLGFAHSMTGCFSDGSISSANGQSVVCQAGKLFTDAVGGSDTKAPNVTGCFINNIAIANNTINNICASNGSLDWVNASFKCTFDDYPDFPQGWSGLVNQSGLRVNFTGWTAYNITNLVDFWKGSQTQTYGEFQDGLMYRISAQVNGTARISTTDTNITGQTWWFTVNVIPCGNPSPTIQVRARQDFDDDEQQLIINNNWLVIVSICIILLVVLFAAGKNRVNTPKT